MEFQEYNGWINRPTWEIFTAFSSYSHAFQRAEQKAAKGPEHLKKWVLEMGSWFKSGKGGLHEDLFSATKITLQDFLMDAVRRVEWTRVYNSLRGEGASFVEQDTDELTKTTYTLLKDTNWKEIVEEAEYDYEADDKLRDWLENRCIDWVESKDARKHIGKIHIFTEKVFEIYFGAIDWNKTVGAFKGE